MRRHVVRLDVLSTEGVERPGSSEAPTAFRIWKAGENITDHGPTVFSDRSATMLLAEQALRGNKYCFDVNHLALDKDAPLESQRAVGWFDIEVRGGDLWAVNCVFSDFIRDGLTKDPPEWKYFSPAYQQDPDTNEVTSLVNIAVTNTPATWRVTALASRGVTKKGSSQMKLEDIKAAFEGADEEKKAAAWKAIAAAMSSADGDGEEKKEPDGDEAPEKKAAKASEEEPEKKDSEEEPEKKDSTLAAALSEVNRLSAKVALLEKKNEADERKTLLASRPDFAPELVKILEKAPMAMVRDSVAKLPKTTVASRSTEAVQATRGGNAEGASRLPPEESRKLKERMGIATRTDSIRWEGNSRVFPAIISQEKK